MSCNHCNTKFNFFHKELGCANCGLLLCSKCLQQRCEIPYKGSGKFNVCRICYPKLKGQSRTNNVNIIVPPDIFLKRLENLENPAAPPITLYKQDPKSNALKMGMSPVDQALVDRLEKLKEKQVVPPADSEIIERLAILKGDRFTNASKPNKQIFTADTRTDQEKINSLLEQYTNEQEIDSSHKSQDALDQRLAKLKDKEHKVNTIEDQESLDSEEELEQITKKIVSEASLEERCPIGSSKKTTTADDSDEDIRSSPELPWCVLCNSDAKYRCYDCGDLYCSSCNTEVHINWEYTDHNIVPYKKK